MTKDDSYVISYKRERLKGRETTLRTSSEQERMLSAIFGGTNYTPSRTINDAIEAVPQRYLERKPTQLHIKLSDGAMKKLGIAAKKHGLSNATLIERAIDGYYKIAVMKHMKAIAEKIDQIEDKKEHAFHPMIDDGMKELLQLILPIEITFGFDKPYWRLSENVATSLALKSE